MCDGIAAGEIVSLCVYIPPEIEFGGCNRWMKTWIFNESVIECQIPHDYSSKPWQLEIALVCLF